MSDSTEDILRTSLIRELIETADALRDDLTNRGHSMHVCRVCGGQWYADQDERHAVACLAIAYDRARRRLLAVEIKR